MNYSFNNSLNQSQNFKILFYIFVVFLRHLCTLHRFNIHSTIQLFHNILYCCVRMFSFINAAQKLYAVVKTAFERTHFSSDWIYDIQIESNRQIMVHCKDWIQFWEKYFGANIRRIQIDCYFHTKIAHQSLQHNIVSVNLKLLFVLS